MKKNNIDEKLTKDIRILINNEEVVKRISILAEENNMDRNTFLIKALDKLVEDEEINNIHSLFKELIQNNIELLKLNSKVINEFCDINCIDVNRYKFYKEDF